MKNGFSINSSIIRFIDEDALLFGNNNDPEPLYSKLEVIRNAFT